MTSSLEGDSVVKNGDGESASNKKMETAETDEMEYRSKKSESLKHSADHFDFSETPERKFLCDRSTSLPLDTVSHSTHLESSRKQMTEKQLRRRNRRRLHRLLKSPEIVPSFLKVIEGPKRIKNEPNTETTKNKVEKERTVLEIDSDDDFLLEPPMVVIDVDEYIGLKTKPKFPDAIPSTNNVRTKNIVLPTIVSSNIVVPTTTTSSSANSRIKTEHNYDPADEGWYEGTHPMSVMPEDEIHLSDIQRFVRDNMEYFSATGDDCVQNAGRRIPTVRGKVGIRCIHCARAVQAAQREPSSFRNHGARPKMPPGAVSYPVSFSALYNLAIQKPQQHFEQCPNLPPELRLNGALGAWKANKTGESNSGPRKRMKKGITSLAYWHISAFRLGLVELGNNGGLRFGRDLSLDLLPFETVRAKLEQDQPALFPKQFQSTSPMKGTRSGSVSPVRVASIERAPINLPKDITAILDEARAEETDQSNPIVFNDDSALLSDFMFLTLKQASICHAVKADFATRGKKTKLMRIGFAGFCCRHCKLQYPSSGDSNASTPTPGNSVATSIFQNSCRSFSSSRDNMASAMSNSFVLHLMKCQRTPKTVRNAIQILKRVHPKQLQQLPYGSQSRFFARLYDRIRAADKPMEEGVDEVPIKADRPSVKKKEDDDDEYVPDTVHSSTRISRHEKYSKRKLTASPRSTTTRNTMDATAVNTEETNQVLKDAETFWDQSENDHLILPTDRNLVSDFVFLCMRQLKAAIPTDTDLRGNRKTTRIHVAGLCCIHCTRNNTTTSGRSFPSAPDNIASTLNTSLYKHLLNCPDVPPVRKRSLAALRKIHSLQCSRLPFGSQRQFFKKLFTRLNALPIHDEDNDDGGLSFVDALEKFSFLQTTTVASTYWQCAACRMVPYDYRSPGSLFLSRPSHDALEKHFNECQGDDINWGILTSSMANLNSNYGNGKDLVSFKSFFLLVRSVVGREDEVIQTFMFKLGQEGQVPNPSFTGNVWRRLSKEVNFNEVQDCFTVLQKELGLPEGDIYNFPDFLKFLQLLSCNFQIPQKHNEVETVSSISTSKHVFSSESKSEYDEKMEEKNTEKLSPKSNHGIEAAQVSLSEKTGKNFAGNSNVLADVYPLSNEEQSEMKSIEESNHEPSSFGKLKNEERNITEGIECGQFDDA